MKLELKQIKHAAHLSEETDAYSAMLYVDGEPAYRVSNDGHGGCDMQHPLYRRDAGSGLTSKADTVSLTAINEWIKANHEPEMFPAGDGTMNSITPDLEWWCHRELERFLDLRHLKRLMSNKIILFRNGALYSLKIIPTPDTITKAKKDNFDAIILNCLATDEAVKLYREAADRQASA